MNQTTLIHSKHGYDDITEVLTNIGWKLIRDIKKDDLILTLNPKTKKIDWNKYLQQNEFDYDGDLISFNSINNDLLVVQIKKYML